MQLADNCYNFELRIRRKGENCGVFSFSPRSFSSNEKSNSGDNGGISLLGARLYSLMSRFGLFVINDDLRLFFKTVTGIFAYQL